MLDLMFIWWYLIFLDVFDFYHSILSLCLIFLALIFILLIICLLFSHCDESKYICYSDNVGAKHENDNCVGWKQWRLRCTAPLCWWKIASQQLPLLQSTSSLQLPASESSSYWHLGVQLEDTETTAEGDNRKRRFALGEENIRHGH